MEIRNNKNIILKIRITKDYSIQFQQKEYSVISEENIIENTLIELPTENGVLSERINRKERIDKTI